MRRTKGFTLIELLVYIVIATIIVGLAGQVFLDATRARLRTTKMLEASVGTGDVITYLQEDMRRLGAKTIMDIGSSSSTAASSGAAAPGMTVLGAVYWDPNGTLKDSSSFLATTSGTIPRRLDAITFRSATYNPTTRVGTGWEEVKYHVDAAGVLWRTVTSRKDMSGNNITPLPDPVKMADHVVAFQLRYGVQANDSLIFERGFQQPCAATSSASSCILEHTATSASVVAKSGIPELGKFQKNTEVLFRVMKGASPSTYDGFPVIAGSTYSVNYTVGFNDVAAANFRADQDLMAIRLSIAGNPAVQLGGTDDVLYYSALDENMSERSFQFTPSVTATANIAMRFHMRDALAASDMDSAKVRFEKLSVRMMAHNSYEWHNSFAADAHGVDLKKRVRAVELSISVQVNKSVSTSTKVIPVLNNGV